MSMSDASMTSVERVFPRGDFLRGRPLRALLWSLVNGILLFMLLGTLFLIFSVLDGRGTILLPADSFKQLSELTGEKIVGESVKAFSGKGILPAVWSSRSGVHGSVVSWLYRTFAPLRTGGSALFALLTFGIVIAFIRTLITSRIARIGNEVGFENAAGLRKSIHRQNLRLGPGNLLDSSSQRPFELFTKQCGTVRDGVASMVRTAARHTVDLAILLLFALMLHPRLALQCLIPLAFFWYLLYREKDRFELSRKSADRQAVLHQDQLAARLRKTRLVKGYSMDALEKRNFESATEQLRESVRAVKKGERWLRWVGAVLIVICCTLIFFMLGFKILNSDSLTAAAGLAMVVAFAWMRLPLTGLQQFQSTQSEINQAASDIYGYLDRIPDVGQAVGAKFLQPMNRALHYESVGYSIPDHGVVLQNFDLKIAAGETVALVSLDPLAAKAAVSLLPRFIEPNQGRVLVDGEDIAWVTLESLRTETAFVAGSESIFAGTVLENITCGSDAFSLQQATDAARMTHAHNFVITLPDGYETIVGENGIQLDPGQAFRLALARAAVRNPAVLIVEEPAEKLDDDTKSWIDDTYSRISRDRTLLILPTRLSTVRKADRIVVIHQGRVEAIGKHEALVRSAAIYRHWEYVHFNEFRDSQTT